MTFFGAVIAPLFNISVSVSPTVVPDTRLCAVEASQKLVPHARQCQQGLVGQQRLTLCQCTQVLLFLGLLRLTVLQCLVCAAVLVKAIDIEHVHGLADTSLAVTKC